MIKGLNSSLESPIHDKIQFLPEEKGKWVKNTNLFKHLKPHIANGGILYSKTTGEQIGIFAAYFSAFKEVFPEEWDDSKNHMLSKNQGIEIMCSVFREIKHRCDLYEGKSYNKNCFKRQISILQGKSLEMKLKNQESLTIPIDWSVDTFGRFSNRAWMAEIRKVIANILNNDM